jgi:hypothetical protein
LAVAPELVELPEALKLQTLLQSLHAAYSQLVFSRNRSAVLGVTGGVVLVDHSAVPQVSLRVSLVMVGRAALLQQLASITMQPFKQWVINRVQFQLNPSVVQVEMAAMLFQQVSHLQYLDLLL